MAKAAQVIEGQKIQATNQLKKLKAKIRFLKSKLVLQNRQDRRQRILGRKRIETKETKMWTGRIKRVRKLARLEETHLRGELLAEQKQAGSNVCGSLQGWKRRIFG